MSTEVSLFDKSYKGGIPAYITEMEMDATTEALTGSGAAGKRISIRGSVFRMVIDGKEVEKNENRSMNIIVVAAHPHVSRTYYKGKFVEGEVSPPDCSADDGITPDAGVPHKQAEKCAICPQNVKGSGEGDSKACRYSRRIAVVLENDIEGSVFQIQLPSKSIFGKAEDGKMPLEAYAKLLKENKVPITAVVTEMKFDTNSSTPKLFFRPIRPLELDELKIVQMQAQSEDAQMAITMTPTALDGIDVTKGPVIADEDEEEFEQAATEEEEIEEAEVVEEVKQKPKVTVKAPAKTVAKPVVKAKAPEVEEPVKKVKKAAPKVEEVAESDDEEDTMSLLDAWEDQQA